MGTQLRLFTNFYVFFFQFTFVLPARYVRACAALRENQNKTKFQSSRSMNFTIHQRNIQSLAIKLFKVKGNLSQKYNI